MNADIPPPEFDAFDQLATMVAIARSDGHCLLANSTLENAVAVSRRALLRGNVLDWFIDPLPMRETLLALQRNEVTSGRFEAQLKRAPLGSSEPLLVRVSASQMDTGDWVLLEIVEIEQQTRQDREERALGLAQANKELLRNLAHEIKNPLGGIRGAAQLLERELDRPQLVEYTQVIIGEADRLQSLVNRLLTPHRLPSYLLTNIHEILVRVKGVVQAEFPQVAIQPDFDTSLPEFDADPEQLTQAILNIVRNAAQALAGTTASPTIRLTTRVARYVTLARKRYRLALAVAIADNGPGIPEALRDKIFYPLVSGREGGSGLGLTLAQSFIQQHHGSIEVESKPGRTCFTIRLPITNGQKNES